MRINLLHCVTLDKNKSSQYPFTRNHYVCQNFVSISFVSQRYYCIKFCSPKLDSPFFPNRETATNGKRGRKKRKKKKQTITPIEKNKIYQKYSRQTTGFFVCIDNVLSPASTCRVYSTKRKSVTYGYYSNCCST